MGLLNILTTGVLSIFTMGELVAITMVLLQLILAIVMLRDERLWRIRRSSEHPSAARGRLEGQSSAGRARRSAQMGLPHGSSPRGSVSSRRRFPRFIRSCQDSLALFEERRKELEAQLPQWPRAQRGCRAAQPEVPAELGLLGGKESPQGPAEEQPKAGTDGANGQDRAGPAGRGSGSSSGSSSGSGPVPERNRCSGCNALAWFTPKDVQVAETGSEGSGSSSSSCSSLGLTFGMLSSDPWWGPTPPPPPPQPLPPPAGREPGWALGKLRARLGESLAAWCSRRLPACCCRRR